MSSNLVTSATMGTTAEGVIFWISSAASCISLSRREQITTFAPSLANAYAEAFPSP